MRTIVFIETNKSGSSREAIKAAERLGFFTVLLTTKQNFISQRTEFPDVHQMIFMQRFDDAKLKETIIRLQKQGKRIKAILSFIDPFVHLAAALSEAFCPNVVFTDPILKMEDKVLTRELLKDLPMSPHHVIYSPDDSLEDFIQKQKEFLPLIVKSPLSTGSKDVLLANDENDLRQSMQELLKKKDNEKILLEEYLSGPQYLIEAFVYNGKVHIIAIIEQEITFVKRFIVTGYCLLTEINHALYDKIYETVSSILQAFQMKNGTCHLEMRLVQGTLKLIEINPRISGGAMNRIIEVGYGINLVEETIQLHLGNEPCLTKKQSKYVYVHYLTVDKRGKLMKVTGKNHSSQYPGVEEVFIRPRKGQILRPPLSMGDRCGYILATSDDKEEAKRIARETASKVRFHLDPF
ncbi:MULTISPECIES: ATP-grasp domain-containing protein [Metabacillus]|uniref:ATP-grasp domain-containing protein n=1 Tax=Metabacillus rhizolycopersici TaxID=2875709 RepID=A0ABS7UN42_9BACI|nr:MULTISPECIES: ATP-grasp domain-containing protein [Metabacillus]MBZ5749459.1 ATP-grasp domain-containing protein [Metabacillus rhizolycopersici]MCM3653232.1 ATP-grasp domain-containing protein [Metabacillus litoralis]